MSSSAQRKRRATGSPLISRLSTKTSRGANARRTVNVNRTAGRTSSRTADGSANINRPSDDPPPPTVTIDVMDSTEDGVDEVVDLTCEGSEAAVVDLTNNDSVLLLDEGPQNRRVTTGESYVVSSDEDEDTPPVLSAAVMSSLHSSSSFRSTPGTISCPVCLDSYSEIVESGRLVVSTKCGHVFCSQCLRDALTSSHTCPTCRKRLTHRQYHPLYV